MIVKETDKKKNPTKLEKAGFKAEKQMAHYLSRAYKNSKEVYVINDLRLESDGDSAQIDHLIIHRFGFLIIESKSVSTEISINENSEWIRHYGGSKKGMPSPVMQAQRQAEFLKTFLGENSEHLLRKKIAFNFSIKKFKFDILVAISDDGIIDRAKNINTDEVHKADQITNSINNLISSYANTNNKIFSLKIHNNFYDSSMKKTINYLLLSHTPKTPINKVAEEQATYSIEPKIKPKASDANKIKLNIFSCCKCSSTDIKIIHGRFGYYFKCNDCSGNTTIKLKCKNESCKHRLRKSKNEFYHECSSCNTSILYFENKVSEKI